MEPREYACGCAHDVVEYGVRRMFGIFGTERWPGSEDDGVADYSVAPRAPPGPAPRGPRPTTPDCSRSAGHHTLPARFRRASAPAMDRPADRRAITGHVSG